HPGNVALAERRDAFAARRLEMVDRPSSELDREGNRTLFGELVPVQSQPETRLGASGQIAPRLGDVEGATLEKDIRSLRDLRGGRKDLGECEVEVRVRVVELRRHRVRAEPRRNTARGFDGMQRRE